MKRTIVRPPKAPRSPINELFYTDGVGKFRCMVCLHERSAHDAKCPIGRAIFALYCVDVDAKTRALDQLDPARDNHHA